MCRPGARAASPPWAPGVNPGGASRLSLRDASHPAPRTSVFGREENTVKKNVGSADRWVRSFIGLAIVAAGYFAKAWWGVIGFVPLVTAAIGWCPLYLPFGLSTCATRKPAK